MIPLPVAAQPLAASPRRLGGGQRMSSCSVSCFPDRGYEHTIAELPPGVDLVALGRRRPGTRTCPTSWPGGPQPPATGCGSPGSSPTPSWPPRWPPPASRLPPTGGWPPPPRSPPGSATADGRWCRTRRTPGSSPSGRPARVTLYDADIPGALRGGDRARPGRSGVDLAAGREPGRAGPGRGGRGVPAALRRLPAGRGRSPSAPGRWIVPGNRWDLLADLRADEPPTVSVVVPYFEAQGELDLVLSGLAVQTHPASRLQVVVADDGSRTPPDLAAAGALPIRLVRQDDRGFPGRGRPQPRARPRRAARCCCSSTATPCPNPTTSPADPAARRWPRTRWPSAGGGTPTSPAGPRPGHRLAGRRRARGPTELAEPEWLLDGYARAADLLHADERSYRFVISAVCALHREPVRRAGRLQRGVHRATAARTGSWPTGPGSPGPCSPTYATPWPGTTVRTGRAGAGPGPAAKNAETLALTRLLPDPVARGRRPVAALPGDRGPCCRRRPGRRAGHRPLGLRRRHRLRILADRTDRRATAAALGDPRIQAGPVPAEVSARAAGGGRPGRPGPARRAHRAGGRGRIATAG